MIEWSQNSRPKQTLRLTANPPRKNPGPKFNPNKIPCRFFGPWKLQNTLPNPNQATQNKYIPNVPTQKNTGIENFEPKKNRSIIPVTWNPESPPSPGVRSLAMNWLTVSHSCWASFQSFANIQRYLNDKISINF